MIKDIEGMTKKLFAASVFDPSYMDAEYIKSQFRKALTALADEELEQMGAIEDTIYQFARKYEPQKELPLEFTCTCGERLLRYDTYAGMSLFICNECEAEWLIGPQEV